jgi:intein-encoded DNA endonuclease-like protein
MEMDNNHVSILLDIKTEIGALSARMMDAAHSRQRMEASIDELKHTVSEIKPVVAVVAEMRPDVEDLKKFKNRIGSYLWVGGTIATGALYLLWQGILYFSDNIKAALGRLFH